MVDCDEKFTKEIINYLSKFKLRSNIQIRDISSEYVVGIISVDKFLEIQKGKEKFNNTIQYRNSQIFIDPRNKELGVRIVSKLENSHLTIKKLNLKIEKPNMYFEKAHSLGIPIKGVENLREKLFGLEANLENLQAIDFKKGCYIGQENTARMKLKNKLRRRLLPIQSSVKLDLGDELEYNKSIVGKILINEPYPFALISLFNPDYSVFKDQEINSIKGKVRIINII